MNSSGLELYLLLHILAVFCCDSSFAELEHLTLFQQAVVSADPVMSSSSSPSGLRQELLWLCCEECFGTEGGKMPTGVPAGDDLLR